MLTEFPTEQFRDVHHLAAHYQDVVGAAPAAEVQPMSVAWKLALSYAVRHPARMLLTSLAMVASACIVVWVVSGYDALRLAVRRASGGVSRAIRLLRRARGPEGRRPSMTSLVESLRQDPAVAEVDAGRASADAAADESRTPARRHGRRPGRTGNGLGQAARRRGPQGADGPSQDSLGRSGKSPNGPDGPRGLRRPWRRPGRPGGPAASALAARRRWSAPMPRRRRYALVEGTWIDPQHPEQRGAVIGKNDGRADEAEAGRRGAGDLRHEGISRRRSSA